MTMETPTSTTPPSWPVLSAQERRVLGVLVEKAQTTKDAGPLSMNSLVTGCNQKSNRDPVMNLNDAQAEEALVSAQQKGLTVRIIGSGRVERWKHSLYEAWHVSKPELAILAELLLRGAQTEGELRARASDREQLLIQARMQEKGTASGGSGQDSRRQAAIHTIDELLTLYDDDHAWFSSSRGD